LNLINKESVVKNDSLNVKSDSVKIKDTVFYEPIIQAFLKNQENVWFKASKSRISQYNKNEFEGEFYIDKNAKIFITWARYDNSENAIDYIYKIKVLNLREDFTPMSVRRKDRKRMIAAFKTYGNYLKYTPNQSEYIKKAKKIS